MVKVNTQDDVYNNIIFFMYQGMNPSVKIDEISALRKFVKQLFDLNIKEVTPFNELETDRIRFLYGIDWENILSKNLKKGHNLCVEEYDIVEYTARLDQHIKKSHKTRG